MRSIVKAINLTSINSDVYIRQGEGRKFENGVIHRFVLRDVHSQQVVNSAAAVIPSLLRNNPQLCFVSKPLKDETLQEKIKSCCYLIINGNAFCLSSKPKAPNDIDPLCTDRPFSEAIVEEPVQCSKGRTLRKSTLQSR